MSDLPSTEPSSGNPLWAAHYADRAEATSAVILENVPVAEQTVRLRLDCPAITERILPGQFVMLRLPDRDDPLLGRPLAMYDTVLDATGKPTGIEVVYLVVGKMTGLLAACKTGERLEVWGPLGNGFSAVPCRHLILVAGGIGQTPFLSLAKQRLGRQTYGVSQPDVPPVDTVTLCYGTRSAEFLVGVNDFTAAGVDVRVSTDDGSAGHHGLVTDLLERTLDESSDDCRVICCGPGPMLRAVAKLSAARGVPCEASLETPMACGIGVCFSCVTEIRQPDGTTDYKRTCVDGPVFDATKIVW